MTGFRLKLRSGIGETLDLRGLTPAALSAGTAKEAEHLQFGRRKLADVFDVSGSAGDTLVIEGGGHRLDHIGAGLDGGTLRVEGDVGAYAGTGMRSGLLDIKGSAGAYLGAGMTGGLVAVAGSAGDFAGGQLPGERFGMTGGVVVVSGGIGARAGDRMRRGTLITRARCGPAAGSRMVGGTIVAEGGFGEGPGALMRRGTLIGPAVERPLATFVDCGRHDLVILRILSRHLTETLGPLAPMPLPRKVGKLAGDMATIGKGEILLTS